MEASATTHPAFARLPAPRPLLRLVGDERLVALVRRGHQAAFEALVDRYQSRLTSFCRHLLRNSEDAEDVVQEVFYAAYGAMLADERPINARPWLYRLARNKCLNHLRRPTMLGSDTMDHQLSDHGATAADKVYGREDLRLLIGDLHDLAETQRTALVLREIEALSYAQVAEAMDTTVGSVKCLLVRARGSLADAAEARRLSCAEVRHELCVVAEGLERLSSPARRHTKTCERCDAYRIQLKATNRRLAAVFPLGPLLLLKKFLIAHLGSGAAGGSGAAAGSAASGAVGASAGSAMTGLGIGAGAMVGKATAGVAALAMVAAGGVEVRHLTHPRADPARAPLTAVAAVPQGATGGSPAVNGPEIVASSQQPFSAIAGALLAPKAATTAVPNAVLPPAAGVPDPAPPAAPSTEAPVEATPAPPAPLPEPAPANEPPVTEPEPVPSPPIVATTPESTQPAPEHKPVTAPRPVTAPPKPAPAPAPAPAAAPPAPDPDPPPAPVVTTTTTETSVTTRPGITMRDPSAEGVYGTSLYTPEPPPNG